jgi:hypothetical protein
MRFSLEEFLARGHLVTQSHVAQLVRSRVGEAIEKRKERIRSAGAAGETGGYSTGVGGTIPPNRDPAQRSGVKQAPWHPQAGTPSSAPPPLPGRNPTPMVPPPGGTPNPGSVTVPQGTPYGAQGQPQGPYTPQPYSGAPPPAMNMTAPLAETVPRPLTSPLAGGPQVRMGPYASQPAFEPQSIDSGGYGPSSQPQSAAGATQYALAAGVGLLLALVIGTGGFLVWRARRPAAEAPVTVVAPSASESPGAPSSEIAFNLTPADATINVDGKEVTTRSLPRPAPGKTLAVVVHAKGHEDQTLLVDYFTASPKSVALKPSSVAAADPRIELPPDPAPPPQAKPVDVKPVDPKPPELKPRPRPAATPALPANPY